MHASSSTAATAAAAIAAVEDSECLAGVRLTAWTVNVDCAGVVAVGTVVEPGTVVDVAVAPPDVVGAVAVGGAVVVGTDMAGVVVVVPDVLVVAPEVEGFAVVECTLADAGIGKVAVELVGAAMSMNVNRLSRAR
jgi:hypothetical protein